MTTQNYRLLNLALPSGGSTGLSSQQGKRAEPQPTPSSPLSPSRSRGSSSTPRPAVILKPLCAQNQGVVSNALTVTGHQPQPASSISQAVVIYGQPSGLHKSTGSNLGDGIRQRSSTSQGSIAPSQAKPQPLPRHASASSSQAHHAPSALAAAAGPATPARSVSLVPPDELTVLKEQILRLQHALESLCAPGPNRGSSSLSSASAAQPHGSGAGGFNVAALAVPAVHAALWSAGAGSGACSGGGSFNSSSTSSASSVGSVGSSTSTSSSSRSSAASSGSSAGGSSRASRSGEGGAGVAPPGASALAVWAAGSGGGAGGLEALMQQACAPLALVSEMAELGDGTQQQQQQQQESLLFGSPQDAALTLTRVKLLELFVRKAHQLLLESAPELLLPPSVLYGAGDAAAATEPLGGAAAAAAGAARPQIAAKPPLSLLSSAEGTASGIPGPGAAGSVGPPGALPTPGSPSLSSRIQSAPTGRHRASGSGNTGSGAAGSGSGSMPASGSGAPAAAGSTAPAAPEGGGAEEAAALVPSSLAAVDLSPAGVLVAACRRLAQLQAMVAGRDSRAAASEQQLTDIKVKLDSAMADNTFLRNMISELQAAARPASRNAMRPEPSLPARPSAPIPPFGPDPALMAHVSALTADLAATRARAEAAQRRVDLSEALLADLRRQLQEANTAAAASQHQAPATSSRACQAGLPDPSLDALRAEVDDLRARSASLELEAAEASRTHGSLSDRASTAEAELSRLRGELSRLREQLADRDRGGAAAAAAAEDVRQQLETERRRTSELQAALDRSVAQAAEADSRSRELEGLLQARAAAAAAVEAAAAQERQAQREAAEEAMEAVRRAAAAAAEGLRKRLAEAEAEAAAARRDLAGVLEKGDKKRAEMAARISSLDSDNRLLSEELRAVRSDLEAARTLAAQWEREAGALREEKFEASARLNSAHHDLETDRRRLADELAAAQRLRQQLMDDANTVKALGTLVQAKTLKLDIGGGAAAVAASAAAAAGSGPGAGVGVGSRPATGDPAAHLRLTNLIKEQQEKLATLSEQLTAREERCGRLQVALTAAQNALSQREAAAEQRTASEAQQQAQRTAQLAELQTAFEAQRAEAQRLQQQLDDLSRHGDSVRAHNAELHKMAERLQREGGAAAADVKDLRAQLEAAEQQLSDERSHRQRLLSEVVALAEQRDTAASDSATLKAQRRSECSRLEDLQAALLLATQKLAGAERTITAQDERIAALLARVRALEERLGALGAPLPPALALGSDGSSDAGGGGAGSASLSRWPSANGAAGGGVGGGLQPPVGSLSLSPEAVAAQQRLSALMTGSAPALGSLVRDMISKVMAAEGAGAGSAGGRGARGARAASAMPAAATGRSLGLFEAQQVAQQAQQRAGGAPQTVPPSAHPGSGGSGSSSHAMLLRPSSASVVGRVQEHAPSGLFGFARQAQQQSAVPASGWASGFVAGGSGPGSNGAGLRPQSAWTTRGAAGGGGGGGGGSVGLGLRRAGSGNNNNLAPAGLSLLAEPDALPAAAAAGSTVAPNGLPYGLRSSSPTKFGALLPSAAAATVREGGGPAAAAAGAPSPAGHHQARGGGAGGGGRPGTAVTKKTVLLLSVNSPAGGQVEALSLDDEWQPV